MMAEKRRTSARIKAEPTSKRTRYSEEIQEKPKSTPKATKTAGAKDVPKAPKEPAPPTLPTRITENKSLPVLEAIQGLKLLDTEYQSIKER
jgi:hypothetical protein